MRAGLLILTLVVASGCDKLFSITHVDEPAATADGAVDAPPVYNTCFDGTFDSGIIDLAHFAISQDAQSTVVPENMGVTVHLTANATGSHYGVVETQTAYDFTGGSAQIEILDVPGDHAEAEFILYRDSSHRYGLTIAPAATTIFLYNGSTTIYQDVGVLPTGSGPPRFVRIVHVPSSNMLEYGVSADGTTWKTELHDAVFPVGALTAQFDAGTYDISTAPGQGRFDNFVVRSRDCL